jgi:ATP-binding cassette subfamily F protein uup
MAIISFRGVSMAFGGPNLLNNTSFEIDEGERVCLIGRNGSGKTTLMNLISGYLTHDTGEIYRSKEAHITYLNQKIDTTPHSTVYNYLVSSFGKEGALIQEYQDLLIEDPSSDRMGELHEELDQLGAWNLQQKIEDVMTRLELSSGALYQSLSGGMKRRVSLARTLVKRPSLLLLDEPTNHLDIDSIQWMEEFLIKNRFTLFFVTHDRSFLQKMATRIIELDRGKITSFPGDFSTYQVRKKELLEAEDKQNANFDKKLAQEEVWIRQGIRARRTRNEGRVRALLEMREMRRNRQEVQGQVKMKVDEGVRSGDIVLVAEEVDYSWKEEPLISKFSVVVNRKDRLAIIGKNGCGKSTLIQLLLGQLQPNQGLIKQGTNLQVAYFDQHREQLDEKISLFESIADGSDKVEVQGKVRGVIPYLGDFLFPADRVWSPVGSLSGGERNRLLLALLFTRPSNVLVLDEPTNDLDSETLELLEEVIQQYKGTVLLVSHDRAFIDNIATSSIVFEENNEVNYYVGGYSDWIAEKLRKEKAPREAFYPTPNKTEKKLRTRKLSNKERDDLENLPLRIEQWEEEKAEFEMQLGDPSLYVKDLPKVEAIQGKVDKLHETIQNAYHRWEEVEELSSQLGPE